MAALQENEALAAQIEALRGAPSPLQEATAKREEHIADRDKFAKLIESLQVRACSGSRVLRRMWPSPLPCSAVHARGRGSILGLLAEKSCDAQAGGRRAA